MAGTMVFTLEPPGNGFPRAIQRGPGYGCSRSDSPMASPSPGGFRQAINGNVGPYRIEVHRSRRCLFEPNHAGTCGILITVGNRRGLDATSERCEMIVPPGVQMGKEALTILRVDFNGQCCVATRTSLGKRPQPHQARDTR